jgi:hypothetical protein
VEILKLWIASGADFEKSVVESNQLGALQKILTAKKAEPVAEIPEGNPDAANPTVINELKQLGAVVLPVANGSHYLSVNLVNVVAVDSALDLLVKVKQQTVWLKAGDLSINDSHLASKLSQLNQLIKLNVERTAITDTGLSQLNALTQLQYLNLNQTSISAIGIKQLTGLKNLRSLFVFGTNVTADDVPTLQSIFPNAKIEIGNYVVPTLETDTTLVK